MRILALHCDSFSFAPERAVDDESIASSAKFDCSSSRFDRCLVLLVSVETDDEKKVRAAAKTIRRLARKLAVHTIVLNGFAHLSNSLAPLDISADVLGSLDGMLRDDQWQVSMTPFGLHKRLVFDVRADSNSQKYLQV